MQAAGLVSSSMQLTVLSYGVAALVCAMAAYAAYQGQELPARARAMRTALVVLAGWAAVLAISGAALPEALNAYVYPTADTLRYSAFLYAISGLSSAHPLKALNRANLAACALALVASLTLPYFLDAEHVLSRVGIALAFLGLVNVEQILRNANQQDARAVKFCAIGLGGIFSFDLFLYAQAEMLSDIDPTIWAVRGILVAMMVPALLVGLRRFSAEQGRMFVSRQMVFYTAAIGSVGAYLTLMALAGYYARTHGGSWSEPIRLMFSIGAVALLLVLLLVDSAMRRFRVFLAKHFFRNKYDYRVEWQRFVRTLSSGTSGGAQQTCINAIAQIFESRSGLLFQREDGAGSYQHAASWFPDGRVTSVPSVPSNSDLVRFLVEREWVIDIHEYQQFPAVYQNISLPDWLLDTESEWRIVSPLLERDQLIGFIVLQSPPVPFRMTFEDRDLLRTVGRHVATLLMQQNSERKLNENSQFDAFNRFAAFVMHDLKNSVAQLQLLVANAARHRRNPEFMDDAISTIANTTGRMTRLIDQLKAPDVERMARPLSIARLLRTAESRSKSRSPVPKLGIVDEGLWVVADPDRLGSVFEHVIRNAQDAAGQHGSVAVEVICLNGRIEISFRDDGPGMTPEFVTNRLFKPFDSTKGAKGMGIGAYQAREYVRELGGEVEVRSSSEQGTSFVIRLPVCQQPNLDS